MFHLDGDGGVYCEDSDARDGPEGFIVLELYAERLLFCWNDLPQDAWFQNNGRRAGVPVPFCGVEGVVLGYVEAVGREVEQSSMWTARGI